MQIADSGAEFSHNEKPVPDGVGSKPAHRTDGHYLAGGKQCICMRTGVGCVDGGEWSCDVREPLTSQCEDGGAEKEAGYKVKGLVVLEQVCDRSLHTIDDEKYQNNVDVKPASHQSEQGQEDQYAHNYQRAEFQFFKHYHFQLAQYNDGQDHVDGKVHP